MKTKFLLILFVLLSVTLFGQTEKDTSYLFAKRGFIVGQGIDSQFGFIGAGLYFATSPRFVTDFVLSSSVWGTRISVSEQYYPERTNNMFLRVGALYSLGATRDGYKTSSTGVIEDITYTYKPVFNATFTVGKSFIMFTKHRFNLEVGYSYLHKEPQDSWSYFSRTVVLTEAEKASKSVFSPGGIVLNASFAFGF